MKKYHQACQASHHSPQNVGAIKKRFPWAGCSLRELAVAEVMMHFFTDGWAKDDLIYQWKEKDPVQVVPGLHLPRFTLEQYKSGYCDVITNTGILIKVSII